MSSINHFQHEDVRPDIIKCNKMELRLLPDFGDIRTCKIRGLQDLVKFSINFYMKVCSLQAYLAPPGIASYKIESTRQNRS